MTAYAMTAYYSEFDPFAAQWIRNLIAAGLVADGEVDERSIVDVRSEDLKDFTQCHFFAGIACWSHALRQAGWPDDRPIWTGSCPCQPFSSAGKQGGFDDPRHLWPTWFNLIRQCRPPTVIGEQSASKDALAWIDLVYSDLEGEGYAVAAVDTCAAGFGAPHIRQRLYFVADCKGHGWGEERAVFGGLGEGGRAQRQPSGPVSGGSIIGLAYADSHGLDQQSVQLLGEGRGREPQNVPQAARSGAPGSTVGDPDLSRPQGRGVGRDGPDQRDIGAAGMVDGLGHTDRPGARGHGRGVPCAEGASGGERQEDGRVPDGAVVPGPTNGFWGDAEWIYCLDDKYRSAEPGTFPLVDRAPQAVGLLRAYGNAIVSPQATEFIKAYMNCRP